MKFLISLFLLCTLKVYTSNSIYTGFEEIVSKENHQKYGQALEAIFTIGLRLQAIMDSSINDNFVVSPLSTTAVIAQLMIGADGEFREQLHDLLSLPASTASFNVTHFSKERNESQILPYATFHLQLAILIKDLRLRKPGEQFTLNLDNAMFYDKDIYLRSIFTSTLHRMYNTDITPLDFQKDTTSIINKWASDHTNGLIKSFLSTPLPKSTASIFMNSIYFNADWETPFSDFLNTMDFFNTGLTEHVKTVFMMGNILDIPYVETRSFRLVCLPYKNKELGMYIILPNINHEYKYNIKKFMESVDSKEMFKGLTEMKPHDVTIKIPKLSLSKTMSILKPLQKYAIYSKIQNDSQQTEANLVDQIGKTVDDFKNFTAPVLDDIYLENAARGINLKVSDIVQQIVFSVNEKGTEAAAISAGLTDYMGGVKTFVLNRPFSFFIKHEATEAVLFWGSISDPSRH